jgi:hypothetical protein
LTLGHRFLLSDIMVHYRAAQERMQAISRHNPIRAAPVSEVCIHKTSLLTLKIQRGVNFIGDPVPGRDPKAAIWTFRTICTIYIAC